MILELLWTGSRSGRLGYQFLKDTCVQFLMDLELQDFSRDPLETGEGLLQNFLLRQGT